MDDRPLFDPSCMGGWATLMNIAIEDPWEAMVYRELSRAADENRTCPTVTDLCVLLDCSPGGTTAGIIKRLERRGLIKVDRYQRERRVTIVATGKSTAEVRTPAPHWRTRPRPASMPSVAPTYLTAKRASMGSALVSAAQQEGMSVQEFIAELAWTGWLQREAAIQQVISGNQLENVHG